MANRKVRPIRPRQKDARAYYRSLDRIVRRTIFSRLHDRLATVESVRQAYRATDEVFEGLRADEARWLRRDVIQRHLDQMEGYHRARLIQTFRTALSVDVSSVLSNPEVNRFMTDKVAENVDLIRTIPGRSHDGLKRKMAERLTGEPFDRQSLSRMLQSEYKSTGYNLRRLTRDQSNKTIGQLTEIRHRQLGITQYEWGTAGDERVRPEHQQNHGSVFDWAKPPDTGHPGDAVQCRCFATPVIGVAKASQMKRNFPKAQRVGKAA